METPCEKPIGRLRKHERKQAVAGARYGRWTVLGDTQGLDGHPAWLVRCECGYEGARQAHTLTAGTSTQCGGCQRRQSGEARTVHGRTRDPMHRIWCSMRRRAGAQRWYFHVSIAPEWLGSDGFLRFIEHIGERPTKRHQIDRIDPLGNYEPGNVRWATPLEQARNRRNNRVVTAFGRSQCVAAWAQETGRTGQQIIRALDRGEMPESVLAHVA